MKTEAAITNRESKENATIGHLRHQANDKQSKKKHKHYMGMDVTEFGKLSKITLRNRLK